MLREMRQYTYTCSTGADVDVVIDNEELIEHLERNGYKVKEVNPSKLKASTFRKTEWADIDIDVDIDDIIDFLEDNNYEVIDREEIPEESTKGFLCQPYVSRLNMLMNMAFEQGCKDTLREFLTSQLNLPFDSDKETICKHLKDKL